MQTSHIDILALRAKEGDRRAANSLAHEVFGKYWSAIRARASLVGDIDEAMSIANFAFLSALRAWRPGESFCGFFIGQLESRCLTFARGRRRHDRKKVAIKANLRGENFSVEAAETAPDASVALSVAARVLTDAERKVFEAARRSDRLTEIAEACGISRQAATRALDRAIAKVRVALELPQTVEA